MCWALCRAGCKLVYETNQAKMEPSTPKPSTDPYEQFLQLAQHTPWALLSADERSLALQFVADEAEYAAYSQALHALAAPPLRVAPPPEPGAAVRAALGRLQQRRVPSPPRYHRFNNMLTLATATLVLLIAVGAGFWLINRNSDADRQPAIERGSTLAQAPAPAPLAEPRQPAPLPPEAPATAALGRAADVPAPLPPTQDTEPMIREQVAGWKEGIQLSEKAKPATNAAASAPPPVPAAQARPLAMDWTLVQKLY